MKKYAMMIAMVLMAGGFGGSAVAQEGPAPAAGVVKPATVDLTLEQAREAAKRRLDMLNAMTEEEWEARKLKRAEMKAKMHANPDALNPTPPKPAGTPAQ